MTLRRSGYWLALCVSRTALIPSVLIACGLLGCGSDDDSGGKDEPSVLGGRTPPPAPALDVAPAAESAADNPLLNPGGTRPNTSALTPSGDGSFRDRAGNRVTVNARGELIDERGNVVVVGADGIVVLAKPEQEVENSFRVPVVTGRLIWAANPVSGRVALVDALTHEVQTLPAGLKPTYLAAIPGSSENRALVINSGSNDATLFRESAAGELSQLQLALHDNANAWTLSEDGRWAIAWSDARDFERLDATEGLQDITVLDLSAATPLPVRFSVGYRPVKLQIDAAETRVYAVTRDGISVIELGATPRLADDIAIAGAADAATTGSGEPVLEDVPITRDGRFAVVRFDGAPRLQVLDLALRTSQLLTLPAEASDVDIAGDGQRAVAVLRDSGQVAVFEPALVMADPAQLVLQSFSGETLGSAALPESGNTALLFTNAIDSDRLAILNLASAGATTPRVVSLKAPIRAVFPTPEGSYAVALLATEDDSTRAGAFSVVPIADALPAKIQGTEAPPHRVSLAQTPNGLRGLVTTRDDAHGIHAVYLVRMPSLQVDRIELSSPPIAVGLLPELGIGYVAQQHPEGRITFINLETGAPETLTGFELADRVVNGDDP
ncbi:MAG: hypothetical protein RL033_3626 [Pseudomonadota bacterium]